MTSKGPAPIQGRSHQMSLEGGSSLLTQNTSIQPDFIYFPLQSKREGLIGRCEWQALSSGVRRNTSNLKVFLHTGNVWRGQHLSHTDNQLKVEENNLFSKTQCISLHFLMRGQVWKVVWGGTHKKNLLIPRYTSILAERWKATSSKEAKFVSTTKKTILHSCQHQ